VTFINAKTAQSDPSAVIVLISSTLMTHPSCACPAISHVRHARVQQPTAPHVTLVNCTFIVWLIKLAAASFVIKVASKIAKNAGQLAQVASSANQIFIGLMEVPVKHVLCNVPPAVLMDHA
jgi:hypothetical protein